jgi:hypothetical protein
LPTGGDPAVYALRFPSLLMRFVAVLALALNADAITIVR